MTFDRAPGLGDEPARPLEDVEERVGRAEPLHAAQHGRRGVLERQVEVRRDAGRRRDRLEQGRPEFGRLQVAHPDALDAVDRAELRQQRLEGAQVAEVLAVGRRVLADQHQFARALLGQPVRLGQDVGRRSRHERPAEGRDRAERAAPVAAGRDLQVGQRRVVEALAHLLARQPRVTRHGDLGRRGRAVHRRDGQQRAPIARRVRLDRDARPPRRPGARRCRRSCRTRARRRLRGGSWPARRRSARPGNRPRRPSCRCPSRRGRCRSSPSSQRRRTRRC